MLKLSFLLIGSQAFKSRWYVISTMGALLVCAAAFLVFHASTRTVTFAEQAIGLFFAAIGIAYLLNFIGETRSPRRVILLAKALGLIVVGSLILDWPVDTKIALPLLFSLAFILDGLGRIVSGVVVRLPAWRWHVGIGACELLLAVLILVEWPLPHDRGMALCIGLLFALTGWLLLRIGLMFRTLESEVAILNLPIFTGRGWYDSAPVLVGEDMPRPDGQVMTVRVWTPAGSATVPERRLLIDRYVAAVDANGVISTGHCALEMAPDLYISHYPAVELDRSGSDFAAALRGTAENDIKGRFQPDYAYESDWWCPADAHVEFRNFDARRLRAFWVGYRQDDTYNLTNRNCSVVVSHALDAALEGALATRFPWLRLFLLLVNPDIWIAAAIRGQAGLATWTPGLTLDYARTLARIVEERETTWTTSFSRFLRRLRRPSGSGEIAG